MSIRPTVVPSLDAELLWGFHDHDEVPADRAAAAREAGKLLTFTLGASAPPVVTPEVDEYGSVNVPASMCLFEFQGPARDALEWVSGNPVVRQVERGLRGLVGAGEGALHLWRHPDNLTTERSRRRLRAVASAVADCRDRRGVAVDTVAGVARRVRNGEGSR